MNSIEIQVTIVEEGLLGLCRMLHSEFSGQGPKLDSKLKQAAIKHLKEKLSSWEPSFGSRFVAYDQAIKNLVEVTLIECDNSIDKLTYCEENQ